MKKRARSLVLIAVAVVLVASTGVAWWLLATESGARWAWARVEAALADRLSARRVAGTLTGGLTLDGLVYRDDVRRVTVERLELAVDPDLFPTRLDVERLVLDTVTIEVTGSAAGDDDGESPEVGDVLAALRLPLPVRLEEGRVRSVSRVGADGTRRELVKSLDVAGRLFETLEIGSLELATPELALSLQGGIELAAPFELVSDARLAVELTGRTPLAASAELAGSLQTLEVVVRGDSPSIVIEGTVSATDADPRFDLVAESPRVTWPLDGDAPVVALENVTARVDGRLSDYAVDLEATVLTTEFRPAEVSARARGDARRLGIDELRVSSDDVAAVVGGELGWAPSLRVDADAVVERFDPQRWIRDWPAGSTVKGRLAGSFGGRRLELRRVELEHTGGPARVAGSGLVDVEAGVVDGTLSWEGLQWPLPPTAPNVTSPAGQLEVRGAPDDWAVSGAITVGAPELADGRFRIDGGGTRDGAEVHIADSEVLGGRVTGELEYGWRGRRPWSASLAAENVNLAPLLPEWPGSLSATFDAGGRRAPFELELDVERLEGRVRGRPVDARGRLTVVGERVRADGLHVASGDSRVELDGDYRSDQGLAFDANIASLGDFLPGMAGRVRATGNLAARPGLPRVTVELAAERLLVGELAVDALTLANAPSTDAPFAATLEAERVIVDGTTLDHATLSLKGDATAHRLEVAAMRGSSSARAVLEGGLDQADALPGSRWEGRLVDANLESAEVLSMALRAPTAVRISAAAATLGRSCLDTADGAAVCASASWSASGAYASVAELSAVPVDLVNLFVASDLTFSQTLTGTVQVAKAPAGRLSAGGRIDVSPGQILNLRDDRLSLETRAGFAHFALNDGSLLSGEVHLPFSDAAEASGVFRVVDIARGPDSPVEGHLRANIRDIAVGANIVPAIDEAGGRLRADIRIGGTLEAPRFTGTASLDDGLLVYDPLGLRVEDIWLECEIREGNRLELRSTFRAGEGRGEITTSADYLQGRQAALEVSIAGSNMTLINVPDLMVKADSDLDVSLQDDEIAINGRVTLPAARLSAVEVSAGSVSESADVEFVGTGPADTDSAAAPARLSYAGRVDLVLGDAVVIDVDVAQARLSGSSTFSWHGPPLPRASGQYAVTGKFQAYGQLLEITEGSIRYPDVPANQPELRLRAERDIFGNSEIRRAGVLVTGTATQPSFEVYTTPPTNEDRAVTLLATGSDFDYEQGVGSVDVGTYIAPRLYASYGIGLFDRDNVVSVRYDLTETFGIKATSGKRASGVDISYTIEH